MNISKLIEQLASMREGHGDVEVRLMHGHDTLAYESEVRGVCCSKYLSDKTDLKLEGLRQNSLNPGVATEYARPRARAVLQVDAAAERRPGHGLHRRGHVPRRR